ncbi:MAG TPA: PhzF family phenazine biosynthesis protein [Bryobacteraceae bacterium]|nr:PhzF family phenazine biosynthesis protein [Bryobacteraceae bacterium]
MQIPLYQVDAFASRPFAGNPAAVCPLEAWLPDAQMQAIALENNLSETAFFVPEGDGYRLRWFTPATEVDLCGHATLASAFVVFQHLAPSLEEVSFQTRSGRLVVRRGGARLTMDFPSRPPVACAPHPLLIPALGVEPKEVVALDDYCVVYETEEQVRALKPDMTRLREVDRFAVIVTAPGRDCDFVSRFFAPAKGVPEDPVTGRAHCTLIPYWARRLGKKTMFARQVSARGGELWCEDLGDRVLISGHAVEVIQGAITL